jgi:hypothetical protein
VVKNKNLIIPIFYLLLDNTLATKEAILCFFSGETLATLLDDKLLLNCLEALPSNTGVIFIVVANVLYLQIYSTKILN